MVGPGVFRGPMLCINANRFRNLSLREADIEKAHGDIAIFSTEDLQF